MMLSQVRAQFESLRATVTGADADLSRPQSKDHREPGVSSRVDSQIMGLFDEPALHRLVDGGCPKCGSIKLLFRTYVDGLVPLMGGEPIGRVKWVYNGEKFVDGVYRIVCTACDEEIFAEDACPRGHAPRGLMRALAAPNGWPVPARCPDCQGEEVGY